MPHTGATDNAMRRAIAVFLLACLGIIIPLAGSPVRFCLLDHQVHIPGISECRDQTPEKPGCCPECGNEEHRESPCCLDIDELPDAVVPGTPDGVPPAIVMDLPEPMFSAPIYLAVFESAYEVSAPIRGPDTPAARRAVLGIWRL